MARATAKEVGETCRVFPFLSFFPQVMEIVKRIRENGLAKLGGSTPANTIVGQLSKGARACFAREPFDHGGKRKTKCHLFPPSLLRIWKKINETQALTLFPSRLTFADSNFVLVCKATYALHSGESPSLRF